MEEEPKPALNAVVPAAVVLPKGFGLLKAPPPLLKPFVATEPKAPVDEEPKPLESAGAVEEENGEEVLGGCVENGELLIVCGVIEEPPKDELPLRPAL